MQTASPRCIPYSQDDKMEIESELLRIVLYRAEERPCSYIRSHGTGSARFPTFFNRIVEKVPARRFRLLFSCFSSHSPLLSLYLDSGAHLCNSTICVWWSPGPRARVPCLATSQPPCTSFVGGSAAK